MTQKPTLNLLDLSRFPFRFSQHEDIAHSDRALHIAGENSSAVSALKQLYSYLSDLAGDSGSAYHLNYFRRGDTFFGFCAQEC